MRWLIFIYSYVKLLTGIKQDDITRPQAHEHPLSLSLSLWALL